MLSKKCYTSSNSFIEVFQKENNKKNKVIIVIASYKKIVTLKHLIRIKPIIINNIYKLIVDGCNKSGLFELCWVIPTINKSKKQASTDIYQIVIWRYTSTL